MPVVSSIKDLKFRKCCSSNVYRSILVDFMSIKYVHSCGSLGNQRAYILPYSYWKWYKTRIEIWSFIVLSAPVGSLKCDAHDAPALVLLHSACLISSWANADCSQVWHYVKSWSTCVYWADMTLAVSLLLTTTWTCWWIISDPPCILITLRHVIFSSSATPQPPRSLTFPFQQGKDPLIASVSSFTFSRLRSIFCAKYRFSWPNRLHGYYTADALSLAFTSYTV